MTHETHPEVVASMARKHPRSRRAQLTIHRHGTTLCPVTGLVRFRDRDQARQALTGARWKRESDLALHGTTTRRECRFYRCPEQACNGGYHLSTSRTWRDDAPVLPEAAAA